ncbi:LodA/GoxA family CTQ-dependent oxidase [Streptomyces halobius]|uniref:LodA/GoxA family CTQ-dependent oxidase n=1 Tax=Streptomyces halobius TaxID=2879846 RepID=UPI0029E7F262|nr:LodA/GoxA family CTQ-dependent oxidase [Streptomyces halobius]
MCSPTKGCTARTVPCTRRGPGDLTRWMAAPWQCDTASCRSGYEVRANLGPRYSPYPPTFWPAQMPNHVLKMADFTTVNKKPTGDDSAREKAFENRAVWLRGLTGVQSNDQRRQMIADRPGVRTWRTSRSTRKSRSSTP